MSHTTPPSCHPHWFPYQKPPSRVMREPSYVHQSVGCLVVTRHGKTPLAKQWICLSSLVSSCGRNLNFWHCPAEMRLKLVEKGVSADNATMGVKLHLPRLAARKLLCAGRCWISKEILVLGSTVRSWFNRWIAYLKAASTVGSSSSPNNPPATRTKKNAVTAHHHSVRYKRHVLMWCCVIHSGPKDMHFCAVFNLRGNAGLHFNKTGKGNKSQMIKLLSTEGPNCSFWNNKCCSSSFCVN